MVCVDCRVLISTSTLSIGRENKTQKVISYMLSVRRKNVNALTDCFLIRRD